MQIRLNHHRFACYKCTSHYCRWFTNIPRRYIVSSKYATRSFKPFFSYVGLILRFKVYAFLSRALTDSATPLSGDQETRLRVRGKEGEGKSWSILQSRAVYSSEEEERKKWGKGIFLLLLYEYSIALNNIWPTNKRSVYYTTTTTEYSVGLDLGGDSSFSPDMTLFFVVSPENRRFFHQMFTCFPKKRTKCCRKYRQAKSLSFFEEFWSHSTLIDQMDD